MDLVRDAGIDVSDWADYERGPRWAAANPLFCYEWAFASDQVVVLNIWHKYVEEHHGEIFLEDNLREHAMFYSRSKDKRVWERRSAKFDQAVRRAAEAGLPVRVIICDGKVRRERRLDARASSVTARMLDPVPWSVAHYDEATGAFTLRRGALPTRLIDQFSTGVAIDSPTETRDANGRVYARSPVVRLTALTRANGKCEWCNEPGFTMPDGSVYLETHHVIPLGQDGPDTVRNVAALCANHHREAHFGAARETIRNGLLLRLKAAK